MKKRILSLLLCLAMLLPMGGASAAGTLEDPLISVTHINGTFIPSVMSAVKAMLSKAMEEHFSADGSANSITGMVKKDMAAGGNISMSTGQTIILLSGEADILIASGTVVDATTGKTVSSGAMSEAHRYIVCEDSSVEISIASDAQVYMSASAVITSGEKPPAEEDPPVEDPPEEDPPVVTPPEITVSPFVDVIEGQWWYDDILKAYARGLVNGMTADTYVPKGELSIAQAIKLAACMNQLYTEGEVTLENSPTQPWYQSYVDYCTEKGIIDGSGYENYGYAITRRQFVEIFHASLPESDYVAINTIPDGSIGDITATGSWVDDVYDFYRAGILTGYTAGGEYAAHDFGAESSITRAEVATIMNRMFDHSARQLFEIE